MPRTFEGCDDRARWSDSILAKAEQAMRAQNADEASWADRAESFVRDPDGPDEPDWESRPR